MIAGIIQNTLFIGIVMVALLCLISGMNTLHHKHTELWFNQPDMLLGIGLIFFALLNFTLLNLSSWPLNRLIAVSYLIFLFLGLAFFVSRSLLLFLRNFS